MCHEKTCNLKAFISVVVQEPDPINLHLHEAFFICKLQPTINSHAELSKLSKLLFYIVIFFLHFPNVLSKLHHLFY